MAAVLEAALDKGTSLTAEDKSNLQKVKKSYVRELRARGYQDRNAMKEHDSDVDFYGDATIRERKGQGTDAKVRVGVTYHISGRDDITINPSVTKK